MPTEVLYAPLFPSPALHSVSCYSETSTVFHLVFWWSSTCIHHPPDCSLLFRFSCQTGVWTHHVSTWYPLLFPPTCCFHLRTLILRNVLPQVQVIHARHIQMLLELSLAKHIWQLLHLNIFVFSFNVKVISDAISNTVSTSPQSPALKLRTCFFLIKDKVCTMFPFFFWSSIYSLLYFRDWLNIFQWLNNFLYWIW